MASIHYHHLLQFPPPMNCILDTDNELQFTPVNGRQQYTTLGKKDEVHPITGHGGPEGE